MESRESTYSLAIEKHDGGYLAYFPSLPGCTTWGPTYEAAVKNAEEALALYLETLSENGDAIPQESTRKTISLSVTVRTGRLPGARLEGVLVAATARGEMRVDMLWHSRLVPLEDL